MNYSIEELNLNNISNYVKVNAKAWQEAYKGIINDSFIQKINSKEEIDKSIEKRKHKLNNPLDKAFLLRVDNKYVGMFRVCKYASDDYDNIGELKALYLLNEVKNLGFGKILLERAFKEIKTMGFNNMIVGCLSDNTNANCFYKHMGGVLIGNRNFTLPNQTLKENVYIIKR